MTLKDDQWIWVLVHGPEGLENLLGQQDETARVSFIPCFLEKDHALQALGRLAKNEVQIYHAQAMLFEDLKGYAGENGFMIFLLKHTGEIIEKITP